MRESGQAPLRLGIAGLGTVGAGVVRLLAAHPDRIAAEAGRRIEVVAVSARDRSRDRGLGEALAGVAWVDDPVGLATHPQVDMVVELIGGSDGPAAALVQAALAAGRPVVTANKALLALKGAQLARQAEAGQTSLEFEAAVGGGIPVIKVLREGLAANRIARVAGILNGTCNYILTQMRLSGVGFADALAEAQQAGYAEADPSFDVEGIDTAHKLAILAALAFGTEVAFEGVATTGITRINQLDIKFAEELGLRIKLLGIAEQDEAGRVRQRVHPAMIPITHPLAAVDHVLNAVALTGDFVGDVLLVGRGAGAGPTASAVVADLIDLARAGTGPAYPVFGVPVESLHPAVPAPFGERQGSFYLRLMVRDRPGVVADIAAILRDEQISMESMLQHGRDPGETVAIVLTTHDCAEAAMERALAALAALPAVTEPPRMIRIEPLEG